MWSIKKNNASPSAGGNGNTNSSFFSGLGFKLIVIILVCGIILLIMNYFGILQLSKTIPQFFGLPSSQGKRVQESISELKRNSSDLPTPTINISSPPEIIAKSEVSGYKLNIQDKKELIDLLKSWNIYDKNHDYPGWGSTGNVPVKIVEVNFVGTDQNENVISGGKDKVLITSAKIFITPEKINVNIYIAPTILSDTKINKDNMLFSQFALATLIIGQDLKKKGGYLEARQRVSDEVLVSAFKKNKIYFKLEKL